MHKIAAKTPLSTWMQKRGLNNGQLADIIGVDKSYVSYLRRGERMPSLELARRIELLSDGAVPASSFIAAKRRARARKAAIEHGANQNG